MVPPNFDPYDTLGVAPSATPDEIRAAYRRLAAECHPDTQPLEKKAWASEQMVRLTAARDVLLNTRQRVRYHQAHADTLRWKEEKNRWRARQAETAYTRARPAPEPAYAPRKRSLWLIYFLIFFGLAVCSFVMLPYLITWSGNQMVVDNAPRAAWDMLMGGVAALGGFMLASLQVLALTVVLALVVYNVSRWRR